MATIQTKIREAFFARLTKSGAVDTQKIEQLRAIMDEGKKLKADDVVKLLSALPGDSLT